MIVYFYVAFLFIAGVIMFFEVKKVAPLYSYCIYYSDGEYLMVYKKDNYTYVQRTPSLHLANMTGSALLNNDMASIYIPPRECYKLNALDYNLYIFNNGKYYTMATNYDEMSFLAIEYNDYTVKTIYTTNYRASTTIVWAKLI